MKMIGHLIYMFARIGFFGFGGGYAMLPIIFQSVQDFGVMSANEFSNLVALSQITPGPMSINAATYVGFNYAGVFGSAAATFGVCLPSFILVTTTVFFLKKFQESKLIQALFSGIRPATVALVASAAVSLGKLSLVIERSIQPVPCIIFVCTLILAGKFKVSPIKITLLSALAGIIFCS